MAGAQPGEPGREAAYARLMESILGTLSEKAPVARRTRSHLDFTESPPSSSSFGSEDDADAESDEEPGAGAEPSASQQVHNAVEQGSSAASRVLRHGGEASTSADPLEDLAPDEAHPWAAVPWAPEVAAPEAATAETAVRKRLQAPCAATAQPGAAKLVRRPYNEPQKPVSQ
jgi:hypothetical protein